MFQYFSDEEPKLLRILVTLVSGAIWTGFFGASILWLWAYTQPGSWYLGPISNLAPAFAMVGGIFGFAIGAALGLLIGVINRDKKFSAILGAGVGLIVIAVFVTNGIRWDARWILTVMSFLPLGGLSGLLTSLCSSTVASWQRSRRLRRRSSL